MSERAKRNSKLVAALVAGGLVVAVAVLMLRFTTTDVWAWEAPNPCDKTTGGGFVFRDDGFRVNFGIVGGCRHGEIFGHVNVVDHSTTPPGHLNGKVTVYLDAGNGYRDLCGVGKVNNSFDANFRVRTLDNKTASPPNGEPGCHDRFGVRVGDFYVLTTRELGPPGCPRGGGNIQLHKPKDGPPPVQDEMVCPGLPGDVLLGF